MKPTKLLCTFFVLLIFNCSIRAAVPLYAVLPATEPADNTTLQKGDQLHIAQMKLFLSLTPATYGKLRGRKLHLPERIAFRLTQRRMKKMLTMYDGDGPDTLQKISWFFKGLILGPIALILGYLLLKDDERELIKWIWFGFIGFAAILALLLLM
jgi:hypothetical protein